MHMHCLKHNKQRVDNITMSQKITTIQNQNVILTLTLIQYL